MDNKFYIKKIEQLTDDKLKELLKLRTKENMEIMVLAEKEATKRGIDLTTIKLKTIPPHNQSKSKKEKGINWADILASLLS